MKRPGWHGAKALRRAGRRRFHQGVLEEGAVSGPDRGDAGDHDQGLACSCCTSGSSGSTCPAGLRLGHDLLAAPDRLAAWNEADVWDQLHVVLLKKLRSAKQLDWSRG
jgi:hypothetical protein